MKLAEGAPAGGEVWASPPPTAEETEALPLAEKRLHFSRSAAYASISAMSYSFWILYMCRHPDTAATREFYKQVPANVYMWPMVAFATAILLNLLSMVFERRPVKRQLCFLAVFISGVAFVYEFLAWNQVAPIYITAAGRPVSLLRYVMWAHATPLMLYALSMISDFSSSQIGWTLAADIAMIVTVIPGELVFAWHRWIWNFISCAIYPYIFHQLWRMYGAAIKEAGADGTQTSLRILRNITVVFWSVFPLVWVLVQLDWVTVYQEELLWCCADTLGKIFFSSTLLHSNFMSIEHRRMMAMRVVEEANRIRVIHELRQLVEQKEAFIALMSHELRTPLNGIIGLSNVLLTDSDALAGDTPKTLTTIRNSGARLLNLINDILDAAALRKGKLVVQQGKVNLRNVADDVIDLCSALAKPGVSLRNKIPASTVAVVGDTSRIVQVLYNLVGNACKFTERGDVYVTAAVVGDGDVVSVSVHDSGIGIPQARLDDIFAPFAQVDMSTTRRYGGTGLGLNLVKQLVEAHGGGITVASRPGRGSVFTFTLRAWRSSVDCSPGPPSAAQRRSLAAAARAAADKAESELSRYRDDKDEEALLLPSGPSAPLLGSRRDSDPELMSRLSHDAQPLNMLQRLSGDSRLRSSYDADYTDYHKAPQQLTPKAAFNAFLTAGAHQVVREIQRGKVGEPSDVAAAAAEQEKERRQRAAAAAPPQHDWLLADRAVREGAAMAELKVLSVDDDPVNQMVVQAMLSKAGFKVLQAPDGQKALDMLESSLRHGCPPHCMLLDVMMPGLSGYDVVQLVRQRHPSLMLPVILVSANSGEEHVVEGLQAGANDYVTKPFGQRELIARIRAQLRTKHFSQGVRVEEVAEAETFNNAAARTSGETSSAGGGGGTDSPVWVSAAPSAAAAAAEPPVPNGTSPSALTLLQQVSSQPAASPAASSPGRAANGGGGGTSQPPDDTLQQQLSEAHRQLVALVTATKASCAAAAPLPPSAAAAAATPLDKLSAAAQTPPAAAPAAAAAGPGPFAAVAPAAAVAAEARPLATNGMRRHSGSHRASWGLLDQSGSGTDLVQLQKLAGMQVGPDGKLPQASVSSVDAATDSSSGKE